MLGTRPALTETLRRIAILLDCSVESLTDSSGEASYMADASELFTLWFEIEDQSAREQLLQFARRLVSGQERMTALR